MIFTKRDPNVHAAQFDGATTSIGELEDMVGEYRGFSLVSDGHLTVLTLHGDGCEYRLNRGDWLVDVGGVERSKLAVFNKECFASNYQECK